MLVCSFSINWYRFWQKCFLVTFWFHRNAYGMKDPFGYILPPPFSQTWSTDSKESCLHVYCFLIASHSARQSWKAVRATQKVKLTVKWLYNLNQHVLTSVLLIHKWMVSCFVGNVQLFVFFNWVYVWIWKTNWCKIHLTLTLVLNIYFTLITYLHVCTEVMHANLDSVSLEHEKARSKLCCWISSVDSGETSECSTVEYKWRCGRLCTCLTEQSWEIPRCCQAWLDM